MIDCHRKAQRCFHSGIDLICAEESVQGLLAKENHRGDHTEYGATGEHLVPAFLYHKHLIF